MAHENASRPKTGHCAVDADPTSPLPGYPYGMLVDAHYYSPGWTSDLRTLVHILPDGKTRVCDTCQCGNCKQMIQGKMFPRGDCKLSSAPCC